MNTVNTKEKPEVDNCCSQSITAPRSIQGDKPDVLTDIYHEEINLAIWQRELSVTLANSITDFLILKPRFNASMTVSPESALASVSDSLGPKMNELSENITEIVEMFCCLFELERVGLRLAVVDNAMCPKFHVDKVPCRLVTTFQGVATEWLPDEVSNREKLGHGSNGKADSESGLYQHPDNVQQMRCGDVALLKGERWEGNEGAGLIHRSPSLPIGGRRFVLTLDFSY